LDICFFTSFAGKKREYVADAMKWQDFANVAAASLSPLHPVYFEHKNL
jgi:hypothetical protein